MSKNLLKALPELLTAGVIDNDTASRIQHYYLKNKENPQNRLLIVFGVLGAILVGLGIILVIAHNWDNIPRFTKAMLAFVPLLLGQVSCGYALFKNKGSIVWRESSAIFLFLSIGASISLLSQIYILGGTLPKFLLTWMLLGLPIVYIMKSSVSSLFYISGITYYAAYIGYFDYPYSETWLFWLLLLAILPKYIYNMRKTPDSNFISFHNWLIPLSVTIVYGSIAEGNGIMMYVAYICLFGMFNIIGNFNVLSRDKLITNGYRIVAVLGTLFILFMLSFDWFWERISLRELIIFKSGGFVELNITIFLTLVNIAILVYQNFKGIIKGFSLNNYVFLLFIFIFFLGYSLPVFAMILINISLMAMGIYNIWHGIKSNHLGILNWGLIIITLLIICRFFDTDIPFVLRGLLFILVGVGFFVTNYYLINKRKSIEKENSLIP